MKGYEEHLAVLPFTTNEEDLLSLYGFMCGHEIQEMVRSFAPEIDFSRERFDAMGGDTVPV